MFGLIITEFNPTGRPKQKATFKFLIELEGLTRNRAEDMQVQIPNRESRNFVVPLHARYPRLVQ
jgi:hypothetical protein